jgi:energy-coupling factor transport system permease protein
MMIGLAVHYLGTLGTKYSSILEAQQARGLDLAGRGLLKRARAFVPVLVALVIASLRLSDTLSLGLAARGFGMPGPRTYLYDLRLRWADWLTLGLCAGMVLLAILTAIG